VVLDVADRAGWITLNRPNVLNALGAVHWARLADLIDHLATRRDIVAVVITGAGRAFSAGGDVATLDKEGMIEIGPFVLRALTAIRRCPKPVIAMVNGLAVGGGNEIVIACDFALAARSARLGQAGTLIGACPVVGGTNMLTMQIGEKRARQIVFFSEKVSAEQAYAWGWVNEVVDDEKLRDTTTDWVRRLAQLHPQSLRIAKATSNVWWNLSYESMVHGLESIAIGIPPDSVAEGRAAFLEKRQPDFDPWR
jgi:enoyl-CoA hydratase/carnithine racemase